MFANRDDLHDDEKIKHFTDELNNLKKRYDELVKPKPIEMIMKTSFSEMEEKKERVMQSVSKSNKTSAELLIDYPKTKPNIIK